MFRTPLGTSFEECLDKKNPFQAQIAALEAIWHMGEHYKELRYRAYLKNFFLDPSRRPNPNIAGFEANAAAQEARKATKRLLRALAPAFQGFTGPLCDAYETWVRFFAAEEWKSIRQYRRRAHKV